jgi:hypothetical protein
LVETNTTVPFGKWQSTYRYSFMQESFKEKIEQSLKTKFKNLALGEILV